ncbi:MAG: HlyD family efflux transporter periplasmic adaptor subunit [Planctomycetaceae bacterium]|nr:HlyD family efflux transporter periplasmic adaptor subunit [Planctomycetaceae bacterium]
MTTKSSTDSATQRPLRIRARGDLEFFPQRFGRRQYWVVKDPVALRYYQLREEEYAILRSLDGRISLAEVVSRFERRFAPRRVTENQVAHFLGNLHGLGLVLSQHLGQGDTLLERGRQQQRRVFRAAASNVLAVRLPGIDPQRLLDRVYPPLAWLFRPGCITGAIVLMVAALLTVLLEPGAVAARLPEMQAFFGPANLVWLVVCLGAVKILHELGHALACRHFGCRCHEVGLMFLVFAPCLYCDVTDAWTLTDKRQRMAVTAAGIYVELVLASMAAFLWWLTTESLLHALCLNVMVLCSVNTVFLNGNPLLRYDGYYLLSDWLEVPNLWQRSRAVLSNAAGRLLLASPNKPALPEDRPVLLGIYGVLSVVYRFVVIVAILGLLYRVLRPMELEILAHAVTAMTIVGLLAAPLSAFVRSGKVPRTEGRGRGRRGPLLLVLATVAVAVCLIPLPCRVRAPVLIEADGAEHVYATVPGRMVSACRAGQKIDEGETLVVLENDDLALQIAKLTAQATQQEVEVRTLEARRGNDPVAAAELPAAKELLAAIRSRLVARQEEADQLIRKAPRGGIVIPAPARSVPSRDKIALASWHGLPTDERNQGAFLETGTLLCSIGDLDRLRAVVYLGEEDVQLVRTGDSARILLDQSERVILEGRVRQIDASRLEAVPPQLAVLGTIPSVHDKDLARPVETYYQIEIALDDTTAVQMVGLRGQARITVRPQSIAQRVVRFLGRTFRRVR